MLKRTIKLFAFALVALGFFAVAKVQANAGELKMHTIYVGHGDCILLESKGHYMLVDSGESSAKDTILSYLESISRAILSIMLWLLTPTKITSVVSQPSLKNTKLKT